MQGIVEHNICSITQPPRQTRCTAALTPACVYALAQLLLIRPPLQVHGKLWLNYGSHSGRHRSTALVLQHLCDSLHKSGISWTLQAEGLRRSSVLITLSPHDQVRACGCSVLMLPHLCDSLHKSSIRWTLQAEGLRRLSVLITLSLHDQVLSC